jgi:hypothetical protein
MSADPPVAPPPVDRARRRLTILSAVSLLAFLLVAWDWARHGNNMAWAYVNVLDRRIGFESSGGRIAIEYAGREGANPGFHAGSSSASTSPPDYYRLHGPRVNDLRFAGLTLQFGEFSGALYQLTFPRWALAMIAAPLPVRWFLIWRATRLRGARRAAGQCLRCGYDLRETPERCPECGLKPVAVAVTVSQTT